MSKVDGCDVLSVEAPVFFLCYLETFGHIFAADCIEVYFGVAVSIRKQGWLVADIECIEGWDLDRIERQREEWRQKDKCSGIGWLLEVQLKASEIILMGIFVSDFNSEPVLSIFVAVIENEIAVEGIVEADSFVGLQWTHHYVIALRDQNGRNQFDLSGLADSEVHGERDGLSGVGSVEIEGVVVIDNEGEAAAEQQRL